jgi:hypothetical protein
LARSMVYRCGIVGAALRYRWGGIYPALRWDAVGCAVPRWGGAAAALRQRWAGYILPYDGMRWDARCRVAAALVQ